MDNRISNWLILVQGFLQDRGTPNGMVRLWLRAHSNFAGRSTAVMLLSWNDNVRQLAEFIWRSSRPDPLIHIAGYSWGGTTARNLCCQLSKRGLSIDQVILSDPVYRHWWMPRRWTTLLPWRTIEFPTNVSRIYWYRQEQNWPRAHSPAAEDTDSTYVSPGFLLKCSHQYMDDAQEFHDRVIGSFDCALNKVI